VNSDEPLHDYQTGPTFSAWIGMVLLFLFFGLLALVVMGVSPRGSTYEEKRAVTRMEKLKTIQQETQKTLTGYAWVDKTKNVVRIPIDEAMKLTVADLAQKKPAPGNPIAAPSPNAAPAAAAPASAASPGTSPGGSPAATGTATPAQPR
jgi:hypothetical protein